MKTAVLLVLGFAAMVCAVVSYVHKDVGVGIAFTVLGIGTILFAGRLYHKKG